MKKNYINTESRLIEIINQQDNGAGTQVIYQLLNEVRLLTEKTEASEKKLEQVYKKVCVSNGQQSIIDAIREEKNWRKSHVQEHQKALGAGKYVLTVIVSVFLAMIPAFYSLIAMSVKVNELGERIKITKENKNG